MKRGFIQEESTNKVKKFRKDLRLSFVDNKTIILVESDVT